MAGTMVVDTLKSGTSGPAVFKNTSDVEVGQLCRAWVNTDAGSATIYGSFNVSSVTYSSNNGRTVNFTNSLPDANYAAVIGTSQTSDAYGRPYQVSTQAASNCQFNGIGGTYSGRFSFAFFR